MLAATTTLIKIRLPLNCLSKQIHLQLKTFFLNVVFAFNYVFFNGKYHLENERKKELETKVHKGRRQRGNFHLFDIKTRFVIVAKVSVSIFPCCCLNWREVDFNEVSIRTVYYYKARYAYNSKRSKRFPPEIRLNY